MQKLYSSKQSKQLDQLLAEYLQIDSYALMQRAGESIYQHIKHEAKVLIITGSGNNAGDGFIVAESIRSNGYSATVWALTSIDKLRGDALKAAKKFIRNGGKVVNQAIDESQYGYVVDAVLGTGLDRPVTGVFAQAIEWMNTQPKPILSVDIPSGLNADTGCIEGSAVQASKTITMIAYKSGLFTHYAKQLCGDIVLEELLDEIPKIPNENKQPGRSLKAPDDWCTEIKPVAYLLGKNLLKTAIQNNCQNSHKGSFGHVLIAGGQTGMPGAVILSAHAALRTGCGSATVITHADHAHHIPMTRPEIMSQAYDPNNQFFEQNGCIKKAQALALGMGLGRSVWSAQLWHTMMQLNIAKIIDADALFHLHKQVQTEQLPDTMDKCILTPHPGEAAMLLDTDISSIQKDRIHACQKISNTYQAVTILKGSGTVICDGENTYICPYGSADLATAGSGDVLSGMLASLLAQGHSTLQAAIIGVIWHALTAQTNTKGQSMIASDIVEELPNVLHYINQ